MAGGRIDGFEILDKLGSGGMATVWKARQISLDRIVALKVLLPEFSRDPVETKSFVKEARTAAGLKHRGIVQAYDVAQEQHAYYIVMEYVSGLTLQRTLERNGAMAPKKVVSIGFDVATALQHAWDTLGMVHRDIKPDNIMVDGDGTIKVTDLGMVLRRSTAGGSHTEMIEGTPNYLSPEQAEMSSRIDFKADIYALGATMYHLLTNQLPFRGMSPLDTGKQQIQGHLKNPRELDKNIPIGVANVVQRMMMKDPADRYDSWSECIADLKKAKAGRMVMIPEKLKSRSTVMPIGKPAASDEGGGAVEAVAKKAARNTQPAPLSVVAIIWLIVFAIWGLAIWIVMQRPAPTPPLPLSYLEQSITDHELLS